MVEIFKAQVLFCRPKKLYRNTCDAFPLYNMHIIFFIIQRVLERSLGGSRLQELGFFLAASKLRTRKLYLQ